MPTPNTPGPATSIHGIEAEAASVARFHVRILLTGESGVGKQTLARAIHEQGRGASAPLVVVDCSEAADAVFESELLDWEDGKPLSHGWIQTAHGGTLLIRSIEKMTARKQSALFRYLDARQSASVSGGKNASDARLIACGCSTLVAAVESGRFHGDLFYRLNTVHLRLEPLRDRRRDIPALFERLLRQAAETHGRRPPAISPDTMRRLVAYSWPGNVRELRSVADDVMANGANVIEPRMLPSRILLDPADGDLRSSRPVVNGQPPSSATRTPREVLP